MHLLGLIMLIKVYTLDIIIKLTGFFGMIGPPSLDGLVSAGFTKSLASVRVSRIRFVIRMAVYAVRLYVGGQCLVYRMGDSLNVERTLAPTIAASVVNVEAFGDCSNKEAIREAVSIAFIEALEASIAAIVNESLPFPTGCSLE